MQSAGVHYYYETRCRRCGKINVWYSSIDKWEDFVHYCTEHTAFPFFMKCDKCQRQTFQDIVSYYMMQTDGSKLEFAGKIEVPARFSWLQPNEIVVNQDNSCFIIDRMDATNGIIFGYHHGLRNDPAEIQISFQDLMERLIAGTSWRCWATRMPGQLVVNVDLESWNFTGSSYPNIRGLYETKDSSNVWRLLWYGGDVWRLKDEPSKCFQGEVRYWRPCQKENL